MKLILRLIYIIIKSCQFISPNLPFSTLVLNSNFQKPLLGSICFIITTRVAECQRKMIKFQFQYNMNLKSSEECFESVWRLGSGPAYLQYFGHYLYNFAYSTYICIFCNVHICNVYMYICIFSSKPFIFMYIYSHY